MAREGSPVLRSRPGPPLGPFTTQETPPAIRGDRLHQVELRLGSLMIQALPVRLGVLPQEKVKTCVRNGELNSCGSFAVPLAGRMGMVKRAVVIAGAALGLP